MNRKFPAVLWLLPIFLGIVGGVAAALIANLEYKASWWELLVAGGVISFLGISAYFVYLYLVLIPLITF